MMGGCARWFALQELSIEFVKEVGATLLDLSPQGLHAIFERLRAILHESSLDKRVQYMIEGLFAVRKKNFEEHPSIVEGARPPPPGRYAGHCPRATGGNGQGGGGGWRGGVVAPLGR